MIYFLQPVDGGPVKIGCSADVPRRTRELQARYRRPLALLATMPGGRPEEREVHGRFAEDRIGRTEQFRPSPGLMEFIGRPALVSANPDAVEAMPARRQRGTLIRVTSEFVEAMKEAASFEGLTLGGYATKYLLPAVQEQYRDAVVKKARQFGGKEPR